MNCTEEIVQLTNDMQKEFDELVKSLLKLNKG